MMLQTHWTVYEMNIGLQRRSLQKTQEQLLFPKVKLQRPDLVVIIIIIYYLLLAKISQDNYAVRLRYNIK